MRHTISVFTILAAIWLFNSGHYTPLLLCLGVASVAFVTWLSHRMDVIDHESQPIHLTLKLPGYYWWLGKKIVQSNIDVVRLILRGNKSISPCIAVLPVSSKTDMGRVIYANSITLTPGTVAMELNDMTLTVHSLTEASLAELKTGEMDRRVSALEN